MTDTGKQLQSYHIL